MNEELNTPKQKFISLLKKTWLIFSEIVSRILTPKRLIYLGILFVIFLGIAIVLDQVIMPWYTRHGEAFPVPNVIAKRFDTAKEILEMDDLTIVKEGEQYDSQLPFGYVIDQNPRPNRMVKKGRRIYVTLSVGEKEIQVPNLIGISENNAVQRLKSLGLRVGVREYEYVPNEPAEVVIGQSKQPKSLVKVGTTIDITVSLGAPLENVLVPSVLGKTLDAAKREIQKSGLTLGRIEYRVTNEFLPNTVIDQSKPAGLKVARGDTLELLVTTVSQSERKFDQW